MMLNVVDLKVEMDKVELGQLENLFAEYCRWAKWQGLYPEFNEKFFDWMNGAGNETD